MVKGEAPEMEVRRHFLIETSMPTVDYQTYRTGSARTSRWQVGAGGYGVPRARV